MDWTAMIAGAAIALAAHRGPLLVQAALTRRAEPRPAVTPAE